MKKQITVTDLRVKNLSKGDIVKLIDGSSLTLLNNDKEFYIVYVYPEITGSEKVLKEIGAVVIEAEITNKFCVSSSDSLYKQDILIAVGTGLFYTSSQMVVKL